MPCPGLLSEIHTVRGRSPCTGRVISKVPTFSSRRMGGKEIRPCCDRNVLQRSTGSPVGPAKGNSTHHASPALLVTLAGEGGPFLGTAGASEDLQRFAE